MPSIKVVVVSPSDVPAERQAAARVVDETARLSALHAGPAIHCWRWEVDAHPGFHALGPQGHIDSIMRIDEADVVVGIFWKRFGTPTVVARSGTEHELERAISSWQKHGRPQIMVYFSAAPAAPTTTEEIDQWRAVIDFREQFPKEGLWWSYTGPEEFERLFRNHLQAFLFSRTAGVSIEGEDTSALLEPPTVRDVVDRPGATLALLDALAQHPLVVLGGLSGSGKTFLAASQLEKICGERYKRVLWHDPAPGESVDSLLATLAATVLPGESTISRCKALSVYLRKNEALLVIDNYHLVDQFSYAVLLSAAAKVSQPCRVLLLSQAYVSPPDSMPAICHVHVPGLDIVEANELLLQKGLSLDEYVVAELGRKTGGLPFAVSLFAHLVVDFGYDPVELLAGAMESASRIRAWFDRILAVLDDSARRLLTYLSLLDVPFNVGVIKAAGRDLQLPNHDATFELLQGNFFVSRHTHYRWTIHELLRTLAQSLMSAEERVLAHTLFGNYFLRGLSRRPSVILSTEDFLSKVRAFRHFAKCGPETPLALRILSELSGTAKARGHYALYLELSRAVVRTGPAKHAWLTYHHAHCALILGQREYCRRLVQPLLFDPAVISSPEVRLSLTRLYAESLSSLDQQTDGANVLKEAIDAAPEEVRQKLPYVQAKTTLSWLLTRVRAYAQAEHIAWELLAEARRKNDTRGGAIGWASLGNAQLLSGDLRSAAVSFEAAKEMFSNVGDRRGSAWAFAGAAECNLMVGSFARAQQNLREASEIAADIGECSVDLQERLDRMLAVSPPPSLATIISGEQRRIHQQVAIKLRPLEL